MAGTENTAPMAHEFALLSLTFSNVATQRRGIVEQLRNDALTKTERDALVAQLKALTAEYNALFTTLSAFHQPNSTESLYSSTAPEILALKKSLLNMALLSKPLTPSLQCIIDFLGPNPEKLKAYLVSVCKLPEPLSDEQIAQKQLAISANLFRLIQSGLLSVKDFTQASFAYPNEPRISELAWKTIFVDDSLTKELASGIIRRYRIFPKYTEQCTTETLKAYALASPAAEGINKFTHAMRSQFTTAEEELFQKPTIAYLCDGFRYTQATESQTNPWHSSTLACSVEENFLLHLYDTDATGDTKNSYMGHTATNPLQENALLFNTVIRELMLQILRDYRSSPNPLQASQTVRTKLLSIHNQYIQTPDQYTAQFINSTSKLIFAVHTHELNDPQSIKFLEDFHQSLRTHLETEIQLASNQPNPTDREIKATELKKHALRAEFFELLKSHTKNHIAGQVTHHLAFEPNAFQRLLKTFLMILANITHTVKIGMQHATIFSSIFKPARPIANRQFANHTAHASAEFVAQTIEAQFEQPLSHHLTIYIPRLLTKATDQNETEQLNFLIRSLSKFKKTATNKLNNIYVTKALTIDDATLKKELHAECAHTLQEALSNVAAFAETQWITNQSLASELSNIIVAAQSAFAALDVTQPQTPQRLALTL